MIITITDEPAQSESATKIALRNKVLDFLARNNIEATWEFRVALFTETEKGVAKLARKMGIR